MNGLGVSSYNPIQLVAAKSEEPGKIIRVSDYHLGVAGWVLVDVFSAFFVMIAACWLTPALHAQAGTLRADPHFTSIGTAAVYAFLFPIISHVFGLHNPLLRRDRLVLGVKCICVAVLSVTALAVVELFFFYTRIGRHILVITFLLSSADMILLRLALWRLSQEGKRRVMVLGSGELAAQVEALVKKSGIPYEVVALESVERTLNPNLARGEHSLGCMNRSQDPSRACGVHEIIACYTPETPRHELLDLSRALLSGVQVTDYSTFIERTFFSVPAEQIGEEWFFQLNTSPDYALYRAAKRVADVVLAASGLMVAGPILLLAMIFIRLESPGPALYSQLRVGQYNRLFRIWKLRTMRDDAEDQGAQWARRNDPRVTRLGRWLRLTRLDEAPQFFNVLRGEMSLVGPRPERPEFVETLAKKIRFYPQRHLVKPGITGWAQINYPYGASTEDALNKLKYDLYYLKYGSPLLDLQITLRTIGAVMKGAR
jgi:exopolysaccharide biosynthesis polyprenyl glycosylphosphotransferase